MPEVQAQITLQTTETLDALLESNQSTPVTGSSELYAFKVPKDFDSPYIDILARELYRRDIEANGGAFLPDGRLKAWPKKKNKWEAFEQAEVIDVIKYFVPASDKVNVHNTPDAISILRNLVDMQILEREGGGTIVWRTTDKGHPMPIGKGIIPRF
ncbi:hypothetical protein BCR33DRAFT_721562 [Rhizoclosmatium globosum]|uniref:Uncharacterized protein n=1 Tax=Rhizoclosmatium globosum TaxID=329046 RepID=A0A1Y2BR18_9FUNG|nr:hypothetical protein BCR33DRAFT_721562 [Rhizoclosmatium globosum]|eukprot:ORY37198.1 hypothetical protein BCR33DRAFT_721562 [Rhizoclosmatium globosum]